MKLHYSTLYIITNKTVPLNMLNGNHRTQENNRSATSAVVVIVKAAFVVSCFSVFSRLRTMMRAKWSVLRPLFAVRTTTTTATKDVRCNNTLKHKHQHNDNHQTSHPLNDDKTRSDDRFSRHSSNDNNPPQAST